MLVLYCTVFGGQVGWRSSFDLEPRSGFGRRVEEDGGGGEGKSLKREEEKVTTNGYCKVEMSFSVLHCWGYEQGLRDVSCLGRS